MLSLMKGNTCFDNALLFICSGWFLIVFGSCLIVCTKYSIDISSALRYFFPKKVIGLINSTIPNNFQPKFPRGSCQENHIFHVVDAAEIRVIITIAGSI